MAPTRKSKLSAKQRENIANQDIPIITGNRAIQEIENIFHNLSDSATKTNMHPLVEMVRKLLQQNGAITQ